MLATYAAGLSTADGAACKGCRKPAARRGLAWPLTVVALIVAAGMFGFAGGVGYGYKVSVADESIVALQHGNDRYADGFREGSAAGKARAAEEAEIAARDAASLAEIDAKAKADHADSRARTEVAERVIQALLADPVTAEAARQAAHRAD